jgi:hypothetical protein
MKPPTHSPQPHQEHKAHPADSRPDDANAFFPDPGEGPALVADSLAQELAEEYLVAATSGEDPAEDARNVDVPEDDGGPYLVVNERGEEGLTLTEAEVETIARSQARP